MHHLGLACSASPTPAAHAIRAHLLLRDHEFGPLALEASRSRKVAAQHALRVLFDCRLVGVEALELDDLRGVCVLTYDVDARGGGARWRRQLFGGARRGRRGGVGGSDFG